MRVATAGNIATRRRQRDIAMAGHQSGDDLDLHIGDRRALSLGKAQHVVVREANVILDRLGNKILDLRHPFWRDKDLAVPAVEFAGVGASARLATPIDICQNRFDPGADIGFAARRRRSRSLEKGYSQGRTPTSCLSRERGVARAIA